MGSEHSVFLPPWEAETEAEKARADDFRAAVKSLSNSTANFLVPHVLSSDPAFTWDWVEHRPFAEAAYQSDERLTKLIPRLVPSRISEEDFWRNYFSHVFAVKRRFEAEAAAPEPSDVAPSCSSAASGAGVRTAAPQPPAMLKSASSLATVSYPEKFHLAVHYANHGPPLPSLSDADRILLEALQMQAMDGPCDKPRPGMWDSAEAKAKYEAWKRLGNMSAAEAMHLYVQAIEVFNAQWLEWISQNGVHVENGAQQPAAGELPKALRVSNGVAPHTGGANGIGARQGAVPKPVAAALTAVRELQKSVATLSPEHLQMVRAECDALSRALQERGV